VVTDAVRGIGLAGYRGVLGLPGAAAFSSAGALARLPQAMVGLGTVLLLVGLGRSYTLAGLVAGALALAQGVAAPWVSRLIDQRGQRWVLLPQLLVHVVAIGLLVLAGSRHAAAWLLLLSVAVLVGVSLPQIGSCARARWSTLLADDPRMHAALSIESLIDEAVFIVGPVLVATLATAIAPAAGLLAALGLVLVGGLLFLAQRRTEPAPRPRMPGHRNSHAMRHRGLVVIVGVFFAIGMLFGLIEVGIVALTREHAHPGAAGTMLALWATGSLLCGTAYGAVQWRTSTARRFQLAAAAMAVGCVLIAATSASASLVAVTVALIIAGLANAPTLITGNTLVPAVVPAAAVTEAYTWLGSPFSLASPSAHRSEGHSSTTPEPASRCGRACSPAPPHSPSPLPVNARSGRSHSPPPRPISRTMVGAAMLVIVDSIGPGRRRPPLLPLGAAEPGLASRRREGLCPATRLRTTTSPGSGVSC
jgi:MFS family permease